MGILFFLGQIYNTKDLAHTKSNETSRVNEVVIQTIYYELYNEKGKNNTIANTNKEFIKSKTTSGRESEEEQRMQLKNHPELLDSVSNESFYIRDWNSVDY